MIVQHLIEKRNNNNIYKQYYNNIYMNPSTYKQSLRRTSSNRIYINRKE